MNTPIKTSQLDNRTYKYIRLKNNLRVLLIHDIDSDVCASSMTVNVGTYSDPLDYQGLAHFLEHMLFMGTKKYPGEDEYSEFISHHGGYSNAYTEEENTVYYFSIQKKYFEKALDIFSRYFIDPLLKIDSVDREINAVHSEYINNINDDNWREWGMICEASANKYPLNRFGIGNLETLKKDNIREELIKFYKQYYSANIMTLIIYGPQNLDMLEYYANKMFNQIPNYNYKPIIYTGTPFGKIKSNNTSPICPILIKMVPIKKKHNLMLIWQVPSKKKHYKISPLDYFGHIIGHESEGSIYYILREKGLCNKLYVFDRHTDNNVTLFMIKIELTNKGFTNRLAIIKFVFDCIKTIKTQGIHRKRYEEFRKERELSSKYEQKEDPLNYIRSLTSIVSMFPMKDILTIGKKFIPYDDNVRSILHEYANYLIPNNTIVIISSPNYKNNTNLVEKWFNIEHKIHENVRILSEIKNVIDGYTLPGRNIFIPDSVKLPIKSQYTPPIKIQDNPVTIWYSSYANFIQPFVHINTYYDIPIAYKSTYNHELTVLFIKYVTNKLNSMLYYSSLADTFCSISMFNGILNIRASGYPENIPKILLLFFTTLTNPNIVMNKLEIIRNEYRDELSNLKYNSPYKHLDNIYKSLYDRKYIGTINERIKINNIPIKDIMRDIINILHIILNKTRIKCLIGGNISKANAIKIGNMFKLSSMEVINMVVKRNVRPLSSDGIPKIKYLNAMNNKEKNSVIGYYIEIGHIIKNKTEDWKKKICCLYLLDQIINEAFFDQLRTKEQLGYFVRSAINIQDNPYTPLYNYLFIIQSPTKDPQYLKKRIGHFIQNFKNDLESISSKEFKRHIKVAITQQKEKDINVIEIFKRDSNAILREDNIFDIKEIYVKTLKSITHQMLIDFYNNYFINRKKSERISGIYGNQ